MKTTWRKILLEELDDAGECWDDVISCTCTQLELDVEFNNGFGTTEGIPFTVWTKKRVYFPVQYDGSEWIESVPRDPCLEETTHVGA
jgi:hypothetical protein